MSRTPAILSSWFLPLVSGALTLAMAGVCIWQWQREAVVHRQWQSAESAAATATAAARTEQERADTLAGKLLAADARIEELNRKLAKSTASAAALAQAEADRQALAAALEMAKTRLEETNRNIAAGNESTATARETITRLTTERDALLDQLNERTRAYNELVRRSNPENR